MEAGRAGKFGFVVGVDRVGQADALKAHGADIVVEDLAELLDRAVIRQAAFSVEPWCLRETTLDLDLLAQTESRVRARPTATSAGAATWTRASRTACRART